MALSTYQMSRNGLVIGDGTNYDLISIDGLGLPDVSAIDVPRLDFDGSFPTRRENVPSRTITLVVWVLGEPGAVTDERMTAFKAAFKREQEPQPLTFNLPLGFGLGDTSNDDRRVEAYVRRRAVDLAQQDNIGRRPVAVELVCLDPRIYEDQLRTISITPSTVDVGRTYDRVYPLTYAAATANAAVATNYGDEETYPTARIDGPCNSPAILSDEVGRALEFTSVLGATDYLEIDFLNQTVLLNGSADRYSEKVFDSEFFALQPGDNTIRFQASGATGATQMTMRWRSAWL